MPLPISLIIIKLLIILFPVSGSYSLFMVFVVNTGDTDGWSSAGLKKDNRLNERFFSVGSALFQGVRL